LAHNDFAGAVNTWGEAEKTIDQGGQIDLMGIVAEGVKNRCHFKVGVGEGINGDFKIGFESGAVGTEMKVDLRDGGHRLKNSKL
jgi:hypothetical protein